MKNISLLLLLIALSSFAKAQISSGGQFTLTQSVVAAGGKTISNGQFKVDGTTGQSVAGQKGSDLSFVEIAGFWIPDELQPTAEHVTVGGMVATESGQGIGNLLVTMTDSEGRTRSVRTSSFGYFSFDGVEVGRVYFFAAVSRRFQFLQPRIARSILESADDLNFVALDY
jgi:hypothetical protein